MKCVMIGFCALAVRASSQPSIQLLGALPGDQRISYALAVSDDGSVVVGISSPFGFFEPFVWTEQTGIYRMPTPPGTSGYTPDAFSDGGAYVLGTHSTSQGGPVGFLWSAADGVVSIGDLPGGRTNSWLAYLSETRVGVGESSFAFNAINAPLFRAVRWSEQGGLEPLPLPEGDPPEGSAAYRLLDDGRIFGRSESGAWFWSEQTGFEMLPGAEGMTRCSPDGSILVGTAPNNPVSGYSTPAYWTADEGLTHLPLLNPDDFGLLRGMSDDGSIIVGVLNTEQVVWVNQKQPMTIEQYGASLGLDMTGWNIHEVSGVSSDGTTIVGTAGRDGQAGLEGFRLRMYEPCVADVNNDGQLNPTDFTAWVASFNAGAKACDQNVDGECSPTDFTAWIANYNAGC